ncbi:MAG: hypothetical protein VKJ24_18965 [Synechococcales bacterium]|nr:hypothetical protein [Synechococcales bacterium]
MDSTHATPRRTVTASGVQSSAQQPLATVIDRIFTTGQITVTDRNYLLLMTLQTTPLGMTDRVKIDRLFQRLQQGLVRVIN